MLEQFRRLSQSKIGIPIIGLMIIGMAAWGIEDIFSGGFGRKIIEAGDRSATEFQINRKFENYLNNLRRDQPGNSITRQQAAENGTLDQIFNVERSRLTSLGYARSLGADASGRALLEDVNSIDAFKNPLTNEFDSQYYRNALSRIDVTPQEFESDTQDRLTLDYLREGISSALIAPPDLARIQAIFDGEVRYVSWFKIQKDSLPPIADPTEEQLMEFYESRKTAFESPERRRLRVLSLSGEDFLHQVDVTEDEIIAYYEATKFQRLEVEEERTFNEYIFPSEDLARAAFGVLAVGGEYTPGENVQQILRTATAEQVASEEIRAQLFTPGVEVGAVAGPVARNSSWIIGQLLEIKEGVPLTLEESRDTIAAEIKAEKAEIEYYSAINGLDDLIGEGRNITEIAAQFGAPAISFEPLDNRGLTERGIFMQSATVSPDAFRQAFELPSGQLTDKFESNTTTVLISVDEIIPKSIPEFADIRERVEQAYGLSKEGETLRASADAVKASLDANSTTLAAEAERFGSEVQTTERGLRRTAIDRTLPQTVYQAAFTSKEGESVVTQGELPTELIIVQLNTIDYPKTNELDVLAPISAPKINEQLNEDLLFAFGAEVQTAMDVKVRDADFAAYKQRLIDDQ